GTKEGREGGVGPIADGADANEAGLRREPGGVEDIPAAVEVSFEVGVEIRRHEIKGVSSDEAGGNRDRATEGDAEVREIPADASALGRGVVGGSKWIGGAAQILDVVVNPIADRCHAREAGLQFA